MMPKLDLELKLDLSREQLAAIGALGLLLLVCAIVTITTLQGWVDAAQTLSEQRDQLASLQARAGGVASHSRAQINVAPPPAFLDATTSGLATAQFQAYLSQMIADQRAMLVSSGIQPAERDDKNDAIR